MDHKSDSQFMVAMSKTMSEINNAVQRSTNQSNMHSHERKNSSTVHIIDT